jgi:hypothetical protein
VRGQPPSEPACPLHWPVHWPAWLVLVGCLASGALLVSSRSAAARMVGIVLVVEAFLLPFVWIAGEQVLAAFRGGRSPFGKAVAVAGLAFTVGVGGLVGQSLWIAGSASRRSAEEEGCLANAGRLAKALQRYVADHGGVFPDGRHWCDELLPYLEDRSALVCPSAPRERCGYAFNDSLSGVHADTLAAPEETIAIFESDRGWNAHGSRELLPAEPRHFSTDVYGRADGGATRFPRKDDLYQHMRPRWQVVVGEGER